ncbi:MAG: hypothetical protein ACKO72_01580 [Actinomycetes bacterium]
MRFTIAEIDPFELGLMTMAPLVLVIVAGWVARRWWARQQTD